MLDGPERAGETEYERQLPFLGAAQPALPRPGKRKLVQGEMRCPMLTKTMTWGFIPMLVLALCWPLPIGYYILLGFTVCVGAMWATQASRGSRYIRATSFTKCPRKVKYEN
jgi:hypothetical protein